MPDLRDVLEQAAERGQRRGAIEVLDAARREAITSSPVRVQPRHRGLQMVTIAAAIAVIAGVAWLVAPRPSTRVSIGDVASSAEALRSDRPTDELVWQDQRGVVSADPVTGAQEPLVTFDGSCIHCGVIAFGNKLFTAQGALRRIDPELRTVDVLGPAFGAFPSADGSQLFVVDDRSQTATTTHTSLHAISGDGTVVGGPWTVPDGYELTEPPQRAVPHRGVLVQTDENAPDHTLAIWHPDTGALTNVASVRHLIDVYVRPDQTWIAAFVSAGCHNTGCTIALADFDHGQTTVVQSPTGESGFYAGGAFSPDGTTLAAFAATTAGTSNPGAELALIDVTHGTARLIDDSYVPVGEPYGFATWSPGGNWLYFGGLSEKVKAHHRGAHDAVALNLDPVYGTIVAPATRDFSSRAPLIQVYKVVRDIPVGLSAEDAFTSGYVALASLPEEFRPVTAVDSQDQIKGMVSVANFTVGQILVVGMFARPGVPACSAQNLPCPSS